MKISIIGAGAVGATLAQRIVESSLADVVLVDIVKGVACGKALDLSDASPIIGHERNIIGTDDYSAIKNSDIVVVTAGFPRKPGMTRDDLISKNAKIVGEISSHIRIHAQNSIVIIVTNPLDTMVYLAYKTTGFDRARVLGMAGVLDGSRLIYLIAEELKAPRSSVQTYVLGSHGDTMVPLISHTSVSGKKAEEVIPADKLSAIVKRTADRGAEIVSLLGSGSAYYSPSAAVFRMISAIINDTKETLVASAYLSGEYGLRDLAIGVPCVIGRNGMEKIVELKLSDTEKSAFLKSAQNIRSSLKDLSVPH